MKPGDLVQHGYATTVYLVTGVGSDRVRWEPEEIGVLLEVGTAGGNNGLVAPEVRVMIPQGIGVVNYDEIFPVHKSGKG